MPQEIIKFRNHSSADLFKAAAAENRRDYWVNFEGRVPGSTGIHADFLNILSKDQKVLDIGCGGGKLASILNSEDSSYIGIDINKSELANASKENPAEYLLADGTQLPFKDGSFDTIVMLGTLGTLDKNSRKSLISESVRLLKDGGHIYSSQFSITDDNPEVMSAYEWDKQFTGEPGDYYVVDWSNNRVIFIDHHFTEPELRSLFEDFAIKDIHIVSEMVESKVGGRLYKALNIWGTKNGK